MAITRVNKSSNNKSNGIDTSMDNSSCCNHCERINQPHAEDDCGTEADGIIARRNEVLNQVGNQTCADCVAKTPDWVSFFGYPKLSTATSRSTMGVFPCASCAQHHYFELGRKRCTIKSWAMEHEWTLKDVEIMERSGNAYVNKSFEALLTKDMFRKKLVLEDEDEEDERRSKFIRNKYKKHLYLDSVIYHAQWMEAIRKKRTDKNISDLQQEQQQEAAQSTQNQEEPSAAFIAVFGDLKTEEVPQESTCIFSSSTSSLTVKDVFADEEDNKEKEHGSSTSTVPSSSDIFRVTKTTVTSISTKPVSNLRSRMKKSLSGGNLSRLGVPSTSSTRPSLGTKSLSVGKHLVSTSGGNRGGQRTSMRKSSSVGKNLGRSRRSSSSALASSLSNLSSFKNETTKEDPPKVEVHGLLRRVRRISSKKLGVESESTAATLDTAGTNWSSSSPEDNVGSGQETRIRLSCSSNVLESGSRQKKTNMRNSLKEMRQRRNSDPAMMMQMISGSQSAQAGEVNAQFAPPSSSRRGSNAGRSSARHSNISSKQNKLLASANTFCNDMATSDPCLSTPESSSSQPRQRRLAAGRVKRSMTTSACTVERQSSSPVLLKSSTCPTSIAVRQSSSHASLKTGAIRNSGSIAEIAKKLKENAATKSTSTPTKTDVQGTASALSRAGRRSSSGALTADSLRASMKKSGSSRALKLDGAEATLKLAQTSS